jgi:ferredoxin
MSATIYFFSATGNSYDVAREIAAKLSDADIQSLVPLASRRTAARDETVGLVFPVYDWNLPLIVRDFLKNLDVSGVKYFFAVATCNYLPGRALDIVSNLLSEKGLRLNAGYVIRMPGTYLPLYGANSPKTQQRKLARKSRKTDEIASAVRRGLNHRPEHSFVGIDRALGSRMEKHMEAFPEKDREFHIEGSCTGCGICRNVCPFGNIEMADGKPQWLHKCQQCLACVHFCPQGCIQIGRKTQGKTRYKNPVVPLKDIMALASASDIRRQD